IMGNFYCEDSYYEVPTLVPGPGVDDEKLFEEHFVGCACLKAKCDSSCPCVQYTKVEANYDEDGRLADDGIDSIVECSDNCGCALLPKPCGNRVVQNGIRVELQLRGASGKGLGVVAGETIKKNTFVCEYAGELISKEEVEKRHSPEAVHNYTFTIKEHVQAGTISSYIDARLNGNISRFINHGCDPNLVPCIVRFNSEAPHAALFACRQIEKGEELCYDYGPLESGDISGDVSLERRKRCHCGARNCRGFLPMSKSATA
uniref:Histone-lysine N-methyltransferase SETMAR n=1 Tax=Steinernema glaseri TaxID=37863 RepID=A0A1I8AGR7_9BILA